MSAPAGQLANQLQAALAELETARELLAAISAAADLPSPASYRDYQWIWTMSSRLSAIKVHTEDCNLSSRVDIEMLHEEAGRPLTYEPCRKTEEATRLANAK